MARRDKINADPALPLGAAGHSGTFAEFVEIPQSL